MKIMPDEQFETIQRQVERRSQKKDQGISFTPENLRARAAVPDQKLPVSHGVFKRQGQHAELADQFSTLMLSVQSDVVCEQSEGVGLRVSIKQAKLESKKQNGTNATSLPLSIQEASSCRSDSTGAIQFNLCFGSLGEVGVQGEYCHGVLKVALTLQTSLKPALYESLARLLEVQLAKELGVKVEVQCE